MDATRSADSPVAQAEQVSLGELQKIVGSDHARQAGPDDAVDGVRARFVVAPGSVQEASEVLKLASRAGLAVSPRGSGTKLGWGNLPSRLDLILSTERLNRVLEHVAGDLVVQVEAGITLEKLQETVSQAGQMLVLDPPEERATLGGIIATNASGPHRLRYGTVRDLLIGITFVLADGTVARAGGKVVKNVAGYDLAKLFTGSLGTLGLIVEAIFRLHPLPASRRAVALDLTDPEAVREAVQSFLHSALVPSALELEWEGGKGTLIALFEGVEPGVVAQSEAALERLQAYGTACVLDAGRTSASANTLPDAWDRVTRLPWQGGRAVGLKVNTVPTEVPQVLRDVEAIAARRGAQVRITGHPGLSVLLVGVSEAVPQIVQELRDRVASGGGSVVVLHAPEAVKRAVDVWGPIGDALPLMRRVKERFDPAGIMNPGRFVGGL